MKSVSRTKRRPRASRRPTSRRPDEDEDCELEAADQEQYDTVHIEQYVEAKPLVRQKLRWRDPSKGSLFERLLGICAKSGSFGVASLTSLM